MDGATTHCRLCQSTEQTLWFIQAGYSIIRCSRCTFVQVAERRLSRAEKTRSFQRCSIYQDGYFSPIKYDDRIMLERENGRRIALVRRFFPAGSQRILDAGCGVGDFIRQAKESYDMWGMDLSPEAIEQAKEQNPESAGKLTCGNLEVPLYDRDFFDALCLWDVIEHIWDPVLILTNALSYVRPGGYIFISTPAIDALIARLLGKYWAFMTPPEHLSFFTKKSLLYLSRQVIPAEIVYERRRGKWTNLGFILYKLDRISPLTYRFSSLLASPRGKRIGRIGLYVPTRDIRYLVMQKRG